MGREARRREGPGSHATCEVAEPGSRWIAGALRSEAVRDAPPPAVRCCMALAVALGALEQGTRVLGMDSLQVKLTRSSRLLMRARRSSWVILRFEWRDAAGKRIALRRERVGKSVVEALRAGALAVETGGAAGGAVSTVVIGRSRAFEFYSVCWSALEAAVCFR